jgi:hypothetical protein
MAAPATARPPEHEGTNGLHDALLEFIQAADSQLAQALAATYTSASRELAQELRSRIVAALSTPAALLHLEAGVSALPGPQRSQLLADVQGFSRTYKWAEKASWSALSSARQILRASGLLGPEPVCPAQQHLLRQLDTLLGTESDAPEWFWDDAAAPCPEPCTGK